MLNNKQINDLAHFFLKELEAILQFKVEFSITDYLNFPPEEDITYRGLSPRVDIYMSINAKSSRDKHLYPEFKYKSKRDTLKLISSVLNLEERRRKILNGGYEQPNYEMDHLLGEAIDEEFQLANLISGIQISISQYISKVFNKVSKLENKVIKTVIIDALIHHIEQRTVEIRNNLHQSFSHTSVPFEISSDLLRVIQCCDEKLDLDNFSSVISTRDTLNAICVKYLLERLKILKTDLGQIYPKDLPTLPVSELDNGNKYFKWFGWENYYLIQYYTEKYADKTTEGVDFPDFVKLLAGRAHKDVQLEWYGSKSILNAFFKDLHLLSQFLEKDNTNPIIEPTRKSLNIHEVFFLPNTDPKQQSKVFSLPINPKDISGRDVRNQQIFESKKENVVVKSMNETKLKSHQRLVLDLLGITLPQE